MPNSRMTIDDYREFHADLLSLVDKGLVYAFPSHEPLDPLVMAASDCSPRNRAIAIPLEELRQIFQESERAFQATHN